MKRRVLSDDNILLFSLNLPPLCRSKLPSILHFPNYGYQQLRGEPADLMNFCSNWENAETWWWEIATFANPPHRSSDNKRERFSHIYISSSYRQTRLGWVLYGDVSPVKSIVHLLPIIVILSAKVSPIVSKQMSPYYLSPSSSLSSLPAMQVVIWLLQIKPNRSDQVICWLVAKWS